MTPRRRFEAAMRHLPTDAPATMELEFHLYQELGGEMVTVGGDFVKLTAKEQASALHRNAEIMIECARVAGHDAIKDVACYWEESPGVPALLWLPDEARLDQIRALREVGGDEYFILGSCGATVAIPNGAEMAEFVFAFYDDPETMHRRYDRVLKDTIEYQQRQLDAGAHGILSAADVAFNNGPFFTPDLLDEFFYPYLRAWAESLNSQGLISVWHTDGDIRPMLDKVVECGVTAIQCVDPLAGMDIVDVKARYGDKLALVGGFDFRVLQFGSPAAVVAETRRIIEGCWPASGFALGGCNAIFQGIPPENYLLMCQTRREYRA
jgi:uroporphyrinogen decarboxylase